MIELGFADEVCHCAEPLIKCDDRGCRCVLCGMHKVREFVLPRSHEEDILAKYSTPGLRKGELTRAAKKEQLDAQGMGKFSEERDKILNQLYPK